MKMVRSLIDFARKEWSLESGGLEVTDGRVARQSDGKTLSYADLASNEASTKILDQPVAEGVTLTPVKEFKVFGKPFARPNARDIVTGAHKYPSDIERPGMLFGKVLRPPSWGARLVSIGLAPAKAMKDVVAVQDDNFVGVAAPTTHQARAALAACAPAADSKWRCSGKTASCNPPPSVPPVMPHRLLSRCAPVPRRRRSRSKPARLCV